MIPADAEEAVLTAEEIAETYGVPLSQVHNWTRMDGFPQGRTVGAVGGMLVRESEAVDDWLRVNFPVHWAKGQESDNPYDLPVMGPKTLVTLKTIAELETKILGRDKPVPTATLRGYISKRTMPAADRNPGDGEQPEVTERMWYWKTASRWLNRPRQRMRRQAQGGER